jgi:hypothetical protein
MIEMASAIGNRWIPVTKSTVLGVGWHAMNLQIVRLIRAMTRLWQVYP